MWTTSLIIAGCIISWSDLVELQKDHMRPLGGMGRVFRGCVALRVYYLLVHTQRRKFGGQASNGIPTNRKPRVCVDCGGREKKNINTTLNEKQLAIVGCSLCREANCAGYSQQCRSETLNWREEQRFEWEDCRPISMIVLVLHVKSGGTQGKHPALRPIKYNLAFIMKGKTLRRNYQIS